MTVICRKCKTSHPDGTEMCECGADLRGRDGLRPAAGMGRTADPGGPGGPPPTRRDPVRDVEPPPRDPVTPSPSAPSGSAPSPPVAVPSEAREPSTPDPATSPEREVPARVRTDGVIGPPPGRAPLDDRPGHSDQRHGAEAAPIGEAEDLPTDRHEVDAPNTSSIGSSASELPIAADTPGRRGGPRVVGRRPGDDVDDAEVEPTTNHRGRQRPPDAGPSPAGSSSPPTGREPNEGPSAPIDPEENSAAAAVSGVSASGSLIETPLSRGSSPAGMPARPQNVGKGEVACATCHRTNSVELRFCRTCGSQLPERWEDDDELDEVEQRDSLWRRLLGTTRSDGRDARTTAQRMRDTGQSKIKYKAKYSLQSKLRALGFMAGGAGALILLLGPVRQRVDRWLNPPEGVPIIDLILEDAVEIPEDDATGPADTDDTAGNGSSDASSEESAETDDAPSQETGRAFDDNPQTALVIDWAGQPIEFTIVVPDDVGLSELVFETGLPNDEERSSLYLRPGDIVLSAQGDTQPIELDDREGPQRVNVDLPDSAEITVEIKDVHERSWETYPRIAISEIRYVD